MKSMGKLADFCSEIRVRGKDLQLSPAQNVYSKSNYDDAGDLIDVIKDFFIEAFCSKEDSSYEKEPPEDAAN